MKIRHRGLFSYCLHHGKVRDAYPTWLHHGKVRDAYPTWLAMLRKGMDINLIQEVTGLSLEAR
ncbi:hypothetical protein TI04_06805 [Achromatium sp. WMS2]|nr:hypothetical protein TI04_06805 [Achromatium sp. WMS2]